MIPLATIFSVKFFLRDNGKGCVFRNKRDYIHPESVNSFIEPEFHHGKNLLPELWVFPIQVRLFIRKIMQVIGIGQRIISPSAAVHFKRPRSKSRFSPFCIPPVIIIAVWICSAAAGL